MKILKTKTLWYCLVMPVVITGLFYFSFYKVVKYIEGREREMFMTGYEIGNIDGLSEGYNGAYDDFYDKLSTNPQVTYLFKKYFPKQEEARIMRAISLAESKGKQTAVNKANRNGSIDSGFFQINTIHKRKNETTEQFIKRMHLLEENFKEARKVLDKQGYTAWTTYKDGKYLKYIN